MMTARWSTHGAASLVQAQYAGKHAAYLEQEAVMSPVVQGKHELGYVEG